MTDHINKPNHYTQGEVEFIHAIESTLTPEQFIGYLKAQCMKYLWRFELKNGCEDLAKSQWYLSKIKELYYEHTKRKDT